MGEATPDDLRALLSRTGLSQREAARRLEISEREFRRMCAGTRPIPNVVLLGLTALAQELDP
jgi:plasmid maintenance system antidote protein VapI